MTGRGWPGRCAAFYRRVASRPTPHALARWQRHSAGWGSIASVRWAAWLMSRPPGTTTAVSPCSSCCAGPISSPTPAPAAGSLRTLTSACTAPRHNTCRRMRRRHIPLEEENSAMSADAVAARPKTLILGLEDRPSLPQAVVMGFQHVLVSNVWLDPVFVAAVGGLSAGLAGNLVNAIFLAAGLVTLTQSTRLVRLPIVEGPSAAFDGLMIGFAKGGQLAMATTGLLIGGVIIFVVAASGLLGLLRRLFSPAVTGAVILLVGIALAGFTLEEFLGGSPTSPEFGSPATLLIATATLLTVVILSGFGRGPLRSYAFIWALLVGDLLSAVFGRLSFEAVGSAALVGIPQLLPYGGLQFEPGVALAILFAFVVAVIEAIGVYYAAGEILGT